MAELVVENAVVAEIKLAVGDLVDVTVDGVNAVAVEAVAAKKEVDACRVVLATRMGSASTWKRNGFPRISKRWRRDRALMKCEI